jgi:hypothetical protein
VCYFCCYNCYFVVQCVAGEGTYLCSDHDARIESRGLDANFSNVSVWVPLCVLVILLHLVTNRSRVMLVFCKSHRAEPSSGTTHLFGILIWRSQTHPCSHRGPVFVPLLKALTTPLLKPSVLQNPVCRTRCFRWLSRC